MKRKLGIIVGVLLLQFAIPSQVILHSIYGGSTTSAFGRLNDGGTTQGISEVCTCSGGVLLQMQSYIDQTQHYYVYQLGVTTEYENYNSMNSGSYFLESMLPVGICLIYYGNSCSSSNNTPEGTLYKLGTS